VIHSSPIPLLSNSGMHPFEPLLTAGCNQTRIGNIIEIQAAAEDFAFERLLSADEAIKLIPVHRNTLLLWARQGKIPSIAVGRRVFFRASDLNRWLEAPCYAGRAVLIASTERTMA
jgi:excisionase family DNA binding protein